MRLNGFVPLFVALERVRTKAAALSAEIFWIELMKARGTEPLNVQGIGGYVELGRKRRKLIGQLENMTLSERDRLSKARPDIMIAVSTSMNFLFMKSLATREAEELVLGGASAVVNILKAALP